MDIQITAKNMELAPGTRDYIEHKLDKITRRLPGLQECMVEVSNEKTRSPNNRYVVQTTLELGGTVLRGETRGKELRTIMDRTEEIMNRQIERYKGKTYHKGRGSSLARGIPETEAIALHEGKVTKRKQFTLRPMSAGRAINRMEMMGHDFYLFLNESSDNTSLVYRRNDGNFGIIESLPE
jgi:ribosome hibernation promoting factor